MMYRRLVVTAFLGLGAVLTIKPSFAKGPHRHHSGHDALGNKLKQNGKHEIGKAGKETVVAEVNNGKVVSMSAGSLPVKKVKTNKKMAALGSSPIQTVSARPGDRQFAQASMDEWYGYGFDTGVEEDYYWYPAADVNTSDPWVYYAVPS